MIKNIITKLAAILSVIVMFAVAQAHATGKAPPPVAIGSAIVATQVIAPITGASNVQPGTDLNTGGEHH